MKYISKLFNWLRVLWFKEFGTKDKAELVKIFTDRRQNHLHAAAMEQHLKEVRHIAELLSVVDGSIGNVSPLCKWWAAFRVLDVVEGKITHISIGCTGRKAQVKKAHILADLHFLCCDSPSISREIWNTARKSLGTGGILIFHERIGQNPKSLVNQTRLN